MKTLLCIIFLSVIAVTGCATQENACEDITLASEQIQQCQSLQRKITNAKDRPIIRTELERQYQNNCIDIRFYRDDKQPAICGNKRKIDKAIRNKK
jgi:hypothetical protein